MAKNNNKSGGWHFYTIQAIFFIDLKISNFLKISQTQRERESEKLCEQVWVRDGDERKPKEKREKKKIQFFLFLFFWSKAKKNEDKEQR